MTRTVVIIALAPLLAVLVSGQSVLPVPSSSYPTIQSAVLASVSGDLIEVAPGSYQEDVDFLGKPITLRSTQGAAATTIVGSGTMRVVDMSNLPAGAVLDGFTITGGVGGILIDGSSSPVIRNCLIRNNHATGLEGGGGILVTARLGAGVQLTLLDCRIVSNTTPNAGGGIQVDVQDTTSFCTLTVHRCLISSNVALGSNGSSASCQVGSGPCPTQGGGGLHLFGRGGLVGNGSITATFVETDIVGNITPHEGAGAYFQYIANAEFENCVIAGNSSAIGNGGGILGEDASLRLRGCYVVLNEAALEGGGLHCSSNSADLISIENSTIADNAGTFCGGITVDGPALTLDVKDSIVWGNALVDIHTPGNPVINLVHANTGIVAASVSATNSMSVAPLFVDRDAEDYHLSRQSPLRDAGDPFALGLTATDRDGTARIVAGTIDIGADEVPAAGLPGSSEDLELHSWKSLTSDPNADRLDLVPGDLLGIRLISAGGGLVGSSPLIVGQSYATGAPPLSPPSLPGVHLDGFNLSLVYGDPAGGFLVGPSLPFDGVELFYLVPPGLQGQSFRLQGFAVTPLAQNGNYAVTAAHDLDF